MKTITDLNNTFRYRADRVDGWHRITHDRPRGDCDDYALTAALLMADRSWFKLWWAILTFQSVFWFCKTRSGASHLILWQRGKGWIDNLNQEWMPKSPHKLRFPFPAPGIALKLAMGKWWA